MTGATGEGQGGATLRLHATTVALGNAAAVLRGASGAGKSDLALRFLSAQSQFPGLATERGLVADDQTLLWVEQGCLMASAPEVIGGQIEVRGLGLVRTGHVGRARVRLAVDLVTAADVERFPLENETVVWLGHRVPVRRLAPFEASAPLKLALWLGGLADADWLGT